MKIYRSFLIVIIKIIQVSSSELNQLYNRFRRLDKDNSGTLSPEELFAIPELAMNPLSQRIIDVFIEESKSEEMDFRHFVSMMSIFSVKATRKEKLHCTPSLILVAFKIYNIDGDGHLKAEEILQVLKLMVGSYLTFEELQRLAVDTVKFADVDGDGFLNVGEFELVLLF